MNVLVKILLKLIQPIVEGMISGASVFRRGEVLAQITNLCKQGSCGVVLLGHHGNRIGNRTKAVVWLRAPIVNGSLQFGNMWKQDELFLCQVLSSFIVELCELRLNHGQLNPGRTVTSDNFLCQQRQPRKLLLHIRMMSCNDMSA